MAHAQLGMRRCGAALVVVAVAITAIVVPSAPDAQAQADGPLPPLLGFEQPLPTSLTFENGDGVLALAKGDLNDDGALDLVAVTRERSAQTHTVTHNVAVLLGNGDTTFAAPRRTPIAATNPVAVAVAELDGSPGLDVAVAIAGDAPRLLVHPGDGEGGLLPATSVTLSDAPVRMAVAALDRDGPADLVVTSDAAVTVVGVGDGGFGQAQRIDTGRTGLAALRVADVTGDGSVDVLVGSNATRQVLTYKGDGQGRLAVPPVVSPVTLAVDDLAVGPFVPGERPDVLVLSHHAEGTECAGYGQTCGVVLRGDGTGSFTRTLADDAVSPVFPTPGGTVASAEVGDLTGDGSTAVVLGRDRTVEPRTRTTNGTIIIARSQGDGTFAFESYVAGPGSVKPTLGIVVGSFGAGPEQDVVVGGLVGSWRPTGYGTAEGPHLVPDPRAAGLTVVPARRDGSGGYQSARAFTTGEHAFGGFTTGDVDKDGIRDVVAVGTSPAARLPELWLLRGEGSGGFAPPQLTGASIGSFDGSGDARLHLVDIDLDDNLDAVWRNLVYWGRGNGTFEEVPVVVPAPTGGFVADSEAADVNGDGHADLILHDLSTNGGPDFFSVHLYAQERRTFLPGVRSEVNPDRNRWTLGSVSSPGAVDVVYVDRDAQRRPYVVVATIAANGVITSSASGTASAALNTYRQDVRLVALRSDGPLDVVTTAYANDGTSQLVVWPGNGDGTFGTARFVPNRHDGSTSLATGDLDGDGHQDVAVWASACSGCDPFSNRGGLEVRRGDGTGALAPPISLAAGLQYAQFGPDTLQAVALRDGAPPSLMVMPREGPWSALVVLGHGDVQATVPDLRVSDLELSPDTAPAGEPGTAPAGQPIDVSWTVTNTGAAVGTGSWVDQIYLSPTPTLGADATLLGAVSRRAPLPTGGSYSVEASVTVTPRVDGPQYLVVVTDRAGSVPGPAANRVTSVPIDVTVPTLDIDGPLPLQIPAFADRYAKVDVTSEHDVHLEVNSEDIVLTASQGSFPWANPTTRRVGRPTDGKTTLLLPRTMPGTWYLALRGLQAAGRPPGAQVELTATEPGTTVAAVHPNIIGNDGKASLTLRGTDLSASQTVQIVGPLPGPTIAGTAPRLIDDGGAMSSELTLDDALPGQYQVQIVDDGRVIEGPSITVESAVCRDISAVLSVPDPIRYRTKTPFTLTISNTGGYDVAVPSVTVASPAASLLSFEIPDSVPGSIIDGATTAVGRELRSANFTTTEGARTAAGVVPPHSTVTIRGSLISDNPVAHAQVEVWAEVVSIPTCAPTPRPRPPSPDPTPNPSPNPTPPTPTGGRPGDRGPIIRQIIDNRISNDPNKIHGPAGYGEPGWTAPVAVMPYQIEFENLESASAAAARVEVETTLDPDVDVASFELGDIAFGHVVVDVPPGLTAYAERLDLRTTFDQYVDVTATLDATARTVTWTLQAIHPVDLVPDWRADKGFLPPEDGEGAGQGSMWYFVRARNGLRTGIEVSAQASIVFDANEAIATNEWVNTFDVGSPSATVGDLPAEVTALSIPWSGVDDQGGPAGSGVRSVDVYLSVDGGPLERVAVGATSNPIALTAEAGHDYGVAVLARDNVGHAGPLPTEPQATTRLVRPTSPGSGSGSGGGGGGSGGGGSGGGGGDDSDSDDGVSVMRVDGVDRYATAAAAAKAAFPDGASTAVLTTGERHPDALAGAHLAAVRSGPILLTSSTGPLPPQTLEALRTLGVRRVVILGGTDAVDASVEAALHDLNLAVERIAGTDRYETMLAAVTAPVPGVVSAGFQAVRSVVQAAQDGDDMAIVATGTSWADALAAAPLASSHRIPIVLTEPHRLTPSAAEALRRLGTRNVLVVGGTAAVSTAVEAELSSMGLGHRRFAGADRLETARLLAEHLVAEFGYTQTAIALARGDDFADSLGAAPLLGRRRIPLLLVRSPRESGSSVQTFLSGTDVSDALVVGGTAAIDDKVLEALFGS